MDFNAGDLKIQNGSGRHNRLLSIVESSAKEVNSKFNRLVQLLEQLNKVELDIREQMKRNTADLREEVEHMEAKQRKIQEVLSNMTRGA